MDNDRKVISESCSADNSLPANRILGYTRWNEDIIQVEQTEDIVTATTSTTTSTTFTTKNPPTKIKISLSQTQIACKPPNKPSAIPKRTIPLRPSAVLNQSMTLQHQKVDTKKLSTSDSDSYNEVFAETKPKAKNITPAGPLKPRPSNLSTDCRIPVTEKLSLLRKFSAPIIEVTPIGQPNGSPKLGARLAAHATTNSVGTLLNVGIKPKPMYTTNNNQYMDDKYKCAVCTNPFSDPRVLDCLHTFCFACLCNLNPVGVLGVAGEKHAEATVSSIEVNGDEMGNRRRMVGREGSDMDLSVSETGKSTESLLPKSLSMASSIGTVAETIRDRNIPRLSIASTTRSIDVKHKNRKKSVSKPLRDRTSSTAAYSDHPKSINCPTCCLITNVPVGGIHRLPSNFMVKRKVKEALLKLGRDLHTTVWCTLCFNETLAIACCLICNMNLCTFCKEAHVRQRSTSLHDVRYLNDLRANFQQQLARDSGNARSGASKVIKCAIHPAHELKLFCINCQQVACNNCTLLLHRGHKCEPIHKASKIYVKMVRTGLDRTRPLTDYASDAILKLNSYTKTVNKRAEVVQIEVDNFLAEYIAALDSHRRTLHTQIQRARESKMQTICDHQSDLAKRCADARTAIQFAEDLLATGNETEILTFTGILTRRFEHCQRSRDSLDPRTTDALTFLPEIQAPFTMDQKNIPMYGIITTQTAASKFCTIPVDGLMQLRVHRKVELTMTARDAEDRPLCHGGLTLDVVLKFRNPSARSVATKVADRRDGTYVISFVPDSAGAMEMSVMVHGKHVKGSPFSLYARTLRPHSGIFHCCTFCSSRGSKTALCACGSVMVGGYRGCGHGHDGHPGRRHWSCCGSDLESSECSATNSFR